MNQEQLSQVINDVKNLSALIFNVRDKALDRDEWDVESELNSINHELERLNSKLADFSNNKDDLPEPVKRKYAVLDEYTELKVNPFGTVGVHIIHLYPQGLAYPDGYWSTQFFKVVGYNLDKMESYDLGLHDNIKFDGAVTIDRTHIYLDGATLIRFNNLVLVDALTQDMIIKKLPE